MKPWLSHWKTVVILTVNCTLAACVAPHITRIAPNIAPAPALPTQVYFYPLHDQNPAQQDRDRYQCYLWAKEKTGFDPSGPQLAPHQRLQVISEPAPGTDIVTGAITGAIIGSILSPAHGHHDNTLVGAMAGAMIGAASETARQQNTHRLQADYDRQTSQRNAHIEKKARNYQRAMMACLEGRGYSVR